MEPQETIAFTDWLAKIDPRVMYEDGAREVWHHVLRNIPARAAKAAVMEHMRLSDIAPKPVHIATRAKQLIASAAAKSRAKQAAIEAATSEPSDELPLRKRDPQRWEQLIEAGKQEAEKAKKERAA